MWVPPPRPNPTLILGFQYPLHFIINNLNFFFMDSQRTPNSFELLGSLGLDLNDQVGGYHCVAGSAKKTNIQNIFSVTIQKPDGTGQREIFIGKKSLDEGCLIPDGNGHTVVSDQYEVYDNQGKWMLRNKERRNSLSTLKAI